MLAGRTASAVAAHTGATVTDPKHAKARELRAQGWTWPQIGREFGVSESTARRWGDVEYKLRCHDAQERWRQQNRPNHGARRGHVDLHNPDRPLSQREIHVWAARTVAAMSPFERRMVAQGLSGWDVDGLERAA